MSQWNGGRTLRFPRSLALRVGLTDASHEGVIERSCFLLCALTSPNSAFYPYIGWQFFRAESGITLCGADAHPCPFFWPVLPAKVLLIQVGFTRGGGWTRLTLTVRQPIHYPRWGMLK